MKKAIVGLSVFSLVLASFAADASKPATDTKASAASAPAVPTKSPVAVTISADKASSASSSDCDACDSGSCGPAKQSTFLSPRARETFGKKLAVGS